MFMFHQPSVTVAPAGLAVRAAALEGGPQPREPHPVGEPVHDPPLPQPVPGRTGRHLRAGEQQRGGGGGSAAALR